MKSRQHDELDASATGGRETPLPHEPDLSAAVLDDADADELEDGTGGRSGPWWRDRRFWLPLVLLIFVAGFWEFGTRLLRIPVVILPPLSAVLQALVNGFTGGPIAFLPHLA